MLADIDHGAAKRGVEKDTKAAGWFHKFVVDPLRGLFATLKLTKHGRELLENREYRYISPTFSLNEDGTPAELHTASLTNMPAFAGFIDPVLNTESAKIPDERGTIKMEMTKEELVTLIKDTVAALNSAPEEKKEEACNTEVTEEVKEEVKEEVAEAKAEGETVTKEDVAEEVKEETSEAKEEKKDDITEEQAEKLVEEAVANACGDKVEVKNEAEKPEVKKEEKKEEVIKIEALNAAPTALGDVSGKSNWMNLHGDEFWKYLREHPEIKG